MLGIDRVAHREKHTSAYVSIRQHTSAYVDIMGIDRVGHREQRAEVAKIHGKSLRVRAFRARGGAYFAEPPPPACYCLSILNKSRFILTRLLKRGGGSAKYAPPLARKARTLSVTPHPSFLSFLNANHLLVWGCRYVDVC